MAILCNDFFGLNGCCNYYFPNGIGIGELSDVGISKRHCVNKNTKMDFIGNRSVVKLQFHYVCVYLFKRFSVRIFCFFFNSGRINGISIKKTNRSG